MNGVMYGILFSILILGSVVFSGCSKKGQSESEERSPTYEGGFAVDLKKVGDEPALRAIFTSDPPQEPSMPIAKQTANLLRRIRENCTPFLDKLDTPLIFYGHFINGHFVVEKSERDRERGDKSNIYGCIAKELPDFILVEESKTMRSARLSIELGDEEATGGEEMHANHQGEGH